MTDRKAELIATLKQVKVERKAYSLRLENETLEQVVELAAATGKSLRPTFFTITTTKYLNYFRKAPRGAFLLSILQV